jgi:hypothetical protein
MGAATRFKQPSLPRQPGECARLKVVQGPDAGCVYVLSAWQAAAGRGEDCDVVLTDLKASRRHAEFAADAGGWLVKDLGSANGILHNGKAAREARLKTADLVTLGETTLEFHTHEAATQLLQAPAKPFNQIVSERQALEARKQQLQAYGGAGRPAPGPAALPGAPKKGVNPLLIVGGIALAGLLFLPDEGAPKKGGEGDASGPATPAQRDLAGFLPADHSRTNRAAEAFFRAGFREYREKNYLRAKLQFENVQQIMPNHALARIYLENCEQAIQAEVKFHLEQGKRNESAGKLKGARAHYEAVMRLLYRDQSNPKFGEARDGLAKVEKQIRGDTG